MVCWMFTIGRCSQFCQGSFFWALDLNAANITVIVADIEDRVCFLRLINFWSCGWFN